MQAMCSSLTLYVSKVAGQFRNPIANQGKTTFKWHLAWPSNPHNLEQIRSLNYKPKLSLWLIEFRKWIVMDNRALSGPWNIHDQITAPCLSWYSVFKKISKLLIHGFTSKLKFRCSKKAPTAMLSACWTEKQRRTSNSDWKSIQVSVLMEAKTKKWSAGPVVRPMAWHCFRYVHGWGLWIIYLICVTYIL